MVFHSIANPRCSSSTILRTHQAADHPAEEQLLGLQLSAWRLGRDIALLASRGGDRCGDGSLLHEALGRRTRNQGKP